MDDTATMLPARRRSMPRRAGRAVKKAPVRSVSMTAFQSSALMRTASPSRVMPAFSTTASAASCCSAARHAAAAPRRPVGLVHVCAPAGGLDGRCRAAAPSASECNRWDICRGGQARAQPSMPACAVTRATGIRTPPVLRDRLVAPCAAAMSGARGAPDRRTRPGRTPPRSTPCRGHATRDRTHGEVSWSSSTARMRRGVHRTWWWRGTAPPGHRRQPSGREQPSRRASAAVEGAVHLQRTRALRARRPGPRGRRSPRRCRHHDLSGSSGWLPRGPRLADERGDRVVVDPAPQHRPVRRGGLALPRRAATMRRVLEVHRAGGDQRRVRATVAHTGPAEPDALLRCR